MIDNDDTINENMNVSDIINNFSSFLEIAMKGYHRYKDIDSEMLKKQTDLLHDFEEPVQTYHETARIGRQIRELRLNRRKYKNAYILYDPIYKFLKNYKDRTGNDMLSDLYRLSDSVLKVEEHLKNQTYNTRSKVTDVQELSISNNDSNNKYKEDIIVINNVLNTYSDNYSVNLDDNSSKDQIIINSKLTLNKPITYKNSSSILLNVCGMIETRLSFNNEYTSSLRKSDQLICENNKHKLTAILSLYPKTNGDVSIAKYVINISIYGIKNDNTKNTKKKKKRR